MDQLQELDMMAEAIQLQADQLINRDNREKEALDWLCSRMMIAGLALSMYLCQYGFFGLLMVSVILALFWHFWQFEDQMQQFEDQIQQLQDQRDHLVDQNQHLIDITLSDTIILT